MGVTRPITVTVDGAQYALHRDGRVYRVTETGQRRVHPELAQRIWEGFVARLNEGTT